MIQGLEIKDENWKEDIRKCHEQLKEDIQYLYPNNSTETLLTIIWDKSKNAFDSEREVQVLIDSKDDLYISVGSAGFVSFQNQEDELTNGAPMKLPLKCWIHTHPFGTAFWSGTDWNSLKTWRPVLSSAIVLGDNEYLAFDPATEIAKKVYYGVMPFPETIKEYKTEEEELLKQQEEE